MHCAGLVIFPTLAPSCASDFSVVGLLLSDQTVQFSLLLLLQKNCGITRSIRRRMLKMCQMYLFVRVYQIMTALV